MKSNGVGPVSPSSVGLGPEILMVAVSSLRIAPIAVGIVMTAPVVASERVTVNSSSRSTTPSPRTLIAMI